MSRKANPTRSEIVRLRTIRLLLHCVLLCLLALVHAPTPKARATAARPAETTQAPARATNDCAASLMGATAIEQLKQQGAYASLLRAALVKKASAANPNHQAHY